MRRVALVSACAVVAAIMLASIGNSATVADERYWPQWRGPQFNGVAPLGNPPVEWSETENIAWKVEIPGSGFATPIVWGDRIFVLTAVPVGDDNVADPDSGLRAGNAEMIDAGADGASAEPGDPTYASSNIRAPREPSQRQRGGGGRQAEALGAMDFTVMAIDRADGSVLWSQVATQQTPHQGKQGNNSWASGSAVTDGEKVFAFFGSRGLFAYDMDGNALWDVDLGDMQIRNGFGEGSTPALHDGKLVIVWDHQGDSFIVALDADSGEEVWRQARDERDTWATPLVVEANGRTQVVTAGELGTRGYDLETGELIWEGNGLTSNPIPSPVYADGIVYLMSGYRGNAARAVRLSEAMGDISDSPAVLWEYNQDTPYVPSPLLYDGNLYFLKSNSPILTAVDVATGQALYGPQRLDGVEEIYASPVGAAGRVYLFGRDGGALVIENGSEFKVLATNSLDDGFEASPAIVGDEMYLRGRRFLYRIEEQGRPDEN